MASSGVVDVAAGVGDDGGCCGVASSVLQAVNPSPTVQNIARILNVVVHRAMVCPKVVTWSVYSTITQRSTHVRGETTASELTLMEHGRRGQVRTTGKPSGPVATLGVPIVWVRQ